MSQENFILRPYTESVSVVLQIFRGMLTIHIRIHTCPRGPCCWGRARGRGSTGPRYPSKRKMKSAIPRLRVKGRLIDLKSISLTTELAATFFLLLSSMFPSNSMWTMIQRIWWLYFVTMVWLHCEMVYNWLKNYLIAYTMQRRG